MAEIKSPGISWFLLPIVIFGVIMAWAMRPCNAPAGKCFVVFSTVDRDPVQMWIGFMVLLISFCMVTGYAITGYWRGILIDASNRISLSRLQLIMWTVLLLSGILIAVLINLCLGKPAEPFQIVMDAQLWALMGISGGSLAASGLIRTTKRTQTPNPEAEAKFRAEMVQRAAPAAVKNTAEMTDDEKTIVVNKAQAVQSSVNVVGVDVENVDPKDSSFLDMFMGNESGNAAQVNVGKVQMFFFTLIVWFGYAASLGNAIFLAVYDGTGMSSMPELSQGMIALLAISHAAYITTKAVPQTEPGR
jgi:hypothetical protein